MRADFTYYRPVQLSEAVALLERHKSSAAILAGGTNLLLYLKEGKIAPEIVLDIKEIEALQILEKEEDGLFSIGPLVQMRRLAQWCAEAGRLDNLGQAAAQLGSPLIRNRATVGGNLCDGSPAADTAFALLSYDTEVVLCGAKGERVLPLEKFFRGPGEVALASGEMMTRIRVAPFFGSSGESFVKLGVRKALQCTIVGVAVSLCSDPATPEHISDVRIALGAVAPFPMRAFKAEAVLRNNLFNGDLVEDAAGQAAEEASPITDFRATEAYRRRMVAELTRRAIHEAWEKANSRSGGH